MDFNTPVIFFTGLDRCGKTTTRKMFAENTNQRFITFDRSPIDNLVYNEMFRDDKFNESTLKKYLNRFLSMGNVYIVRLLLDIKEINKRAKKTEGIKYDVIELVQCSQLFDKYLCIAKNQGFNIIEIECNGKTVKKIVEEVISKIN